MTEQLRSAAKRKLRQRMAALRDGLSDERRTLWSQQICGNVSSLLSVSAVSSFMVYVSYRSEADTRLLIEWGWRQGLDIIVPRCNPDNRTMKLYRLKEWSELTPGAYGILEPNPHKTAACAENFIPGAIIVPGLSFDRSGGRLGYGGGYYDRFYDRLLGLPATGQPMPEWIGLSFEAQLVERIPSEPHDVRMDIIVTERTVYKPVAQEKGG